MKAVRITDVLTS